MAKYNNALSRGHLGSSSALTDESGNLRCETAYDAFGNQRDPNTGGTPSSSTCNSLPQTNGGGEGNGHGYTDQQQLDGLNLIHMNGRVYDPITGRFISADPNIQDPTFSQSYNRYAYVYNNPMNATDPSGFDCTGSDEDLGNCDYSDVGETGLQPIDATGIDIPSPDLSQVSGPDPSQIVDFNALTGSHIGGGTPVSTGALGTPEFGFGPGNAYIGFGATGAYLNGSGPVGQVGGANAVGTNVGSNSTTNSAAGENAGVTNSTTVGQPVITTWITPCGSDGLGRSCGAEVCTAGCTWGGIGNSISFIGAVFGATESAAVNSQGKWLGQDLKYHPSSWGGNGVAGSKTITLLNKELAHGASITAFAIGGAVAVKQMYDDLKANNYSDAAQDFDDFGMSAVGVFGGRIGYGLSSAYFLGRISGGFDTAASAIDDAIETYPYASFPPGPIP